LSCAICGYIFVTPGKRVFIGLRLSYASVIVKLFQLWACFIISLVMKQIGIGRLV